MPDVDLDAIRARDARVYTGFVDDPEAVTQQERDRHDLLVLLAEREQRIAVLDHLETEARNTCFRRDEQDARLRAAAQRVVRSTPQTTERACAILWFAAALEDRDV